MSGVTGVGHPKYEDKLLTFYKGYKMEYKQMSQNSWIVKVQENGKTKELFIEFPPGSIDQVGWDVGDTVLWEELPTGGYSLKKKEDDSDRE